MDGAEGDRGSTSLRAAFWGIVAVAVAFRFYALGRLPGINGDEAWCGALAARIGHANPDGWRTSSGNLPGPFQLGLLALFSWVAPPSFALLRVPSVLASLGQGVLTFVVAREHLGRGVAIVAVLLTAALPIEIAYARLGWDPSHTGLVAIAATHFALTRRMPAMAALFALALWVHPTNVFLAPFLLVSTVLARQASRPGAKRLAVVSLIGGAGLLAVLLIGSAVPSVGARTAPILSRLTDPRQWVRFALMFVRLLDGDTIFTYITGSGLGTARLPVDLGALALLGAVAVLGGRRLKRQPAKLAVVLGWLASLVVFFVFAGPEALAPHLERYGMSLLVPTILALSILVVEAAPGLRGLAPVAVVCVALLFAFWRCYFVALETTGSTSHATFWTGPVEPKAEAFRRIEVASRPGRAEVVAEGWWLYWPLAYLARGTAVDVRDGDPLADPSPAAGTTLVGFPGGRFEAWAKRSGAARLVWEIPGAGGKPAVQVWKTPDR